MQFTRSHFAFTGEGKMTVFGSPNTVIPFNSLPRRVKDEMISFNHPGRDIGMGDSDVGGPWWSSTAWFAPDPQSVKALGLGRMYEGTISLSTSTSDLVCKPKPADFLDLIGLGSTAIRRTTPTNPIGGAAQFLGELREGVPRTVGSTILKERCRSLRNAGSEYLNVEFGWKPMVADVRKFARAVKDSRRVLRQLERNSGTKTRRRYSFPESKIVGPVDGPKWGWVAPFRCDGGQLDSWMIGSGPLPVGYSFWSEETTKTWFSGAFRYTLPSETSNPNFLDRMDRWEQEANKLLGTRLTPGVMWELAPWSWAVDWFSNVGDVANNLSAFAADGLALLYGFIMRETSQINRIRWTGYINTPSSYNVYHTIEESFGFTQKVRLRATPYGFGLELDGLTPRQWAISSALGATRTPRIKL